MTTTYMTQAQFANLDETTQALVIKAVMAGDIKLETVTTTTWEGEEPPATEADLWEWRRGNNIKVASYTRRRSYSFHRTGYLELSRKYYSLKESAEYWNS